MQKLIKNKANVHVTDFNGNTLLDHAIDQGDDEIAWMLIQKKVKVTNRKNFEKAQKVGTKKQSYVRNVGLGLSGIVSAAASLVTGVPVVGGGYVEPGYELHGEFKGS